MAASRLDLKHTSRAHPPPPPPPPEPTTDILAPPRLKLKHLSGTWSLRRAIEDLAPEPLALEWDNYHAGFQPYAPGEKSKPWRYGAPPFEVALTNMVGDSTLELALSKNAEDTQSIISGNSPPDASAPAMSRAQFWLCLLGLNMSLILVALDLNIVTTALVTISTELGDYALSSWLGTSFLVAFATGLLIWVKLGIAFGNKPIFLLCTIIFVIGSAMCGWAPSMFFLIASRAIQGLGAGGIYSLIYIIIAQLVELRKVGFYFSILGIVWGAADVAGPLLGGLFSEYVSWRWCFWVNLCISPISIFLVIFCLQLPKGTTTASHFVRHFDYLGTLMLCGGSIMLLLGLSLGGTILPWESGTVLGTLLGGASLLVVFLFYENFISEPFVDTKPFRTRAVLSMLIAQFFFGMTILACMFFIPQFYQIVFADSAVLAGVGLLPMLFGIAAGNPIAAWVIAKYGWSLWSALAGASLEVLGTALMTRWDTGTSRGETIPVTIIIGLGIGIVLNALIVNVQNCVKPEEVSMVTGLSMFFQVLGSTFGIAIFSTIYQGGLRGDLQKTGLDANTIQKLLNSVDNIRASVPPAKMNQVLGTFATAMQSGWWFVFGASMALTVTLCFGRQRAFEKVGEQED